MYGSGERGPEGNVPNDPALANARETGGRAPGGHDTIAHDTIAHDTIAHDTIAHDTIADPDGESTTGVDENQEFVGRVAGDDAGYAGETGAERRAQSS